MMIRLLSKAPQSGSVYGLSGRVHRAPRIALLLAALNACALAACGTSMHGSGGDTGASGAQAGQAGQGASSGFGSADAAAGGGQATGGTFGGAAGSGGGTGVSGAMGISGATGISGDGHAGSSNGGASASHAGADGAGSGNVAGFSGGVGGGGAAALAPVIPAITGTCPTFTTGTVTVAGLSGISMQVGTKMQGTGSLLFYWHGTGSTAGEVNALVPAGVRQELLNQGGVIVSFQSSLSSGGDCSGTATFSKDDFKVADLIAACAVRDYGIDPRRIYTTGCSAGGLQAACMGALRSSYIAAAVPNSGGEVTPLAIQDPSRVPAVMTMHGGASDMVVVSFATTSAAYDQQMKTAGSYVVDCNHGGGHCGAPAALYSAAWEFMKAHPFGVAPEPYASGLPATFPSYCEAQ